MSTDEANHKPTYAQVAASPPSSHGDDENDAKSMGESDNNHNNVKIISTDGGAHFSKPKVEVEENDKGGQKKPPKDSISSVGSSEPEIINVEPPIPPPVDKMKKQPEPVKPGKKEEPAIVDNAKDDFAPLKHTTMLTRKKKNENNNNKEERVLGKGKGEQVDDTEFEVVSDETESKRRSRNRAMMAAGGAALVALVAFGIWKWTTRKARR